jgi:hypothetical protein
MKENQFTDGIISAHSEFLDSVRSFSVSSFIRIPGYCNAEVKEMVRVEEIRTSEVTVNF